MNGLCWLIPQVDVNVNEEARKIIHAGQYRPTPNDQVLGAMEIISEVWPGPLPHGYLHVFVGLPSKVGSPGNLTAAHDAGVTETCEWILFF
jgi:hypothetical protein